MSSIIQFVSEDSAPNPEHENTFHFVIADPSTNLKPGRDPAIRSHCMQGKNRRDGSRRSQRDKKKKEAGKAIVVRKPSSGLESNIPRPLDSWSLMQFACPDIDSEAKSLVLKAFSFTVAQQTLTPLDFCIDFDRQESVAFQWLYSDAAFVRSVLYAAYAVQDITSPTWDGGQPGPATVLHLNKTLSLLRSRLESSAVLEDEAVLYIVGQLGLFASCYGQYRAAVAHFSGAHKIIKMRGGMSFLKPNPKLHFKIDRLDLAFSLSSGKKPFHIHELDSITWEPLSHPSTPISTTPDMYQPPDSWDWRLRHAFTDLQNLVLTINNHARSKTQYNASSFQSTLSSLQSRLTYLADLTTSPVENLVRLTMLALLSTMLQTSGVPKPYGWIIRQIEQSYSEASDALDSALRTWVLSMAAVSVSGIGAQWLRVAWIRNVAVCDWQEMKGGLMSVMWIECIHDGPGKKVHRMLTEDTELQRCSVGAFWPSDNIG